MKIPQLFQHFEHLTSPLAVAMSSWTQEFRVKTVVSEVVRSALSLLSFERGMRKPLQIFQF